MSKIWKKILKRAIIILAVIAVITGGYFIYAFASYSRIADKLTLATKGTQNETAELEKEYTLTTFDVGFGAFDGDFSFFLEKTVTNKGTKTGKAVKGESFESVRKNIVSNIEQLVSMNSDFIFVQQLDRKADRSYGIDEITLAQSQLKSYQSVFALNLDTPFLMYPIGNPYGKNESGIATFSQYSITAAARYSLPTSTNANKLLDLDACAILTRTPIVGTDRELVLINTQFSCITPDVCAAQLKVLNEIMAQERDKGNYVVAGGSLCGSFGETSGTVPSNVSVFGEEDFCSGFTFVSDQSATKRIADSPFNEDSFVLVSDGFFVSDNIEVISTVTFELDFVSSNHNPIELTFLMNDEEK